MPFHRLTHLHIIDKYSLRPLRAPNKQKQHRKSPLKYIFCAFVVFTVCFFLYVFFYRGLHIFSGGTKTVMPLLINYSSWHRKSLKPICSVFASFGRCKCVAAAHEYIINRERLSDEEVSCILLVKPRWPHQCNRSSVAFVGENARTLEKWCMQSPIWHSQGVNGVLVH